MRKHLLSFLFLAVLLIVQPASAGPWSWLFGMGKKGDELAGEAGDAGKKSQKPDEAFGSGAGKDDAASGEKQTSSAGGDEPTAGDTKTEWDESLEPRSSDSGTVPASGSPDDEISFSPRTKSEPVGDDGVLASERPHKDPPVEGHGVIADRKEDLDGVSHSDGTAEKTLTEPRSSTPLSGEGEVIADPRSTRTSEMTQGGESSKTGPLDGVDEPNVNNGTPVEPEIPLGDAVDEGLAKPGKADNWQGRGDGPNEDFIDDYRKEKYGDESQADDAQGGLADEEPSKKDEVGDPSPEDSSASYYYDDGEAQVYLANLSSSEISDSLPDEHLALLITKIEDWQNSAENDESSSPYFAALRDPRFSFNGGLILRLGEGDRYLPFSVGPHLVFIDLEKPLSASSDLEILSLKSAANEFFQSEFSHTPNSLGLGGRDEVSL